MTIRSQFVKKNFRCRRARSETGPSHPKKPICKEEFSLPAGAVRDRPEPPQKPICKEEFSLPTGAAEHRPEPPQVFEKIRHGDGIIAKIHGEMMGKTGLGN
jgi:hypothetical protein